jgi:hypothetical protein
VGTGGFGVIVAPNGRSISCVSTTTTSFICLSFINLI